MNRLIQFFLLLAVVISYFFIPTGFNRYFTFLILIFAVISILSHFFIRRESIRQLRHQYFKISTIFILTFSIVHFQIFVDYLFGFLNESNLFIWINHGVVGKSLIISTLAIISYNFFYDIHEFRDLKLSYSKSIKYISLDLLYIIALVVLILYFIFIDKSFLFGGYGDNSKGEIAGYLSLIFECIIYATIILNCRNILISRKKINSFYSYIKTIQIPFFLLLTYLLSVLISGDRGPLIFNSIFVFFGYIYITNKKFSILQFSLLFIIAALIITTLGIARKFKDETKIVDRIQMAVNNKEESPYYPQSFSPFTKELASSGRTVNLAVESNFRSYGLFALQDIMLIFPSLKGYFISIFQIPKPLTSSAQYLTYYNLGSDATWGVGTSCVADTYLDFGTLGIIIVFSLFGFTSRYLEVKTFGKGIPSFIILVISFSLISSSVYIPRSTILYSFNKIILISLVIYVSALLNDTKFR